MAIDPLLERVQRLYTPIFCDVMDGLGCGRRFLGEKIQALFPDPHLRVAGYAYPVRTIQTSEYVEIDELLRMVDSIPAGSMVVVAADSDCDCSMWGGLMSARSLSRGARGAVVTGAVRDVAQIADCGFPVFCASRNPQDIRRRAQIVAYNRKVDFNGVTIMPGDIIYGDANGVVSIPGNRAEDIITLAETGVREESATQAGLLSGESAVDIFQKFRRF